MFDRACAPAPPFINSISPFPSSSTTTTSHQRRSSWTPFVGRPAHTWCTVHKDTRCWASFGGKSWTPFARCPFVIHRRRGHPLLGVLWWQAMCTFYQASIHYPLPWTPVAGRSSRTSRTPIAGRYLIAIHTRRWECMDQTSLITMGTFYRLTCLVRFDRSIIGHRNTL